MHFRPPPQAAGLVSICLRRCTKRFDAWQFCHGMLVIQASKSERSIVSVAGKEGEGFKHAKAAPVRRFSQVFYLGARFSNLSFPAGVSRCCLRHGGLRRVFFRLILSYCTKTLEVGLWICRYIVWDDEINGRRDSKHHNQKMISYNWLLLNLLIRCAITDAKTGSQQLHTSM